MMMNTSAGSVLTCGEKALSFAPHRPVPQFCAMAERGRADAASKRTGRRHDGSVSGACETFPRLRAVLQYRIVNKRLTGGDTAKRHSCAGAPRLP